MLNEANLAELASLDIKHLLHPNTNLVRHSELGPRIFVRGRGAKVYDIRGREYINAVSWLWLSNIGHGREEMAEVAESQIREIEYVPAFWGVSSIPAIKLAGRVASLTPPGLDVVLFNSGGSDSVETAFKVTRLYHYLRGNPRKVKIIARDRAYHGVFVATTGATGLPAFHEGFGPVGSEIVRAPTHYCYRCPLEKTYPSCDVACVDEIGAAIHREDPDTVAAVIAEPVVGPGGVIPPPAEYWPRLERICHDNDVLLIADEVITGFGRTGKWFGVDHWGVVPDLMTLAKGITSGYAPLGALVIHSRVAETFRNTSDRQFHHGVTYTAHPLCCALGLKNLEIIDREELRGRAGKLGRWLLSELKPLEGLQTVGEVRGFGLLLAIEMVKDKRSKDPFPLADEEMMDEFSGRGLIVRVMGGRIILSPPFVLTDDEAETLAREIIAGVTAFDAGSHRRA